MRLGCRRCGAQFGTPNVAHEAKALARNGADQPLVLAAVADRLPRGVDPTGQRRLRDDPSLPDFFNQIVLADDAITVLDQIDQEIEYLRLDGNPFAAAGKLPPIAVKYVI